MALQWGLTVQLVFLTCQTKNEAARYIARSIYFRGMIFTDLHTQYLLNRGSLSWCCGMQENKIQDWLKYILPVRVLISIDMSRDVSRASEKRVTKSFEVKVKH